VMNTRRAHFHVTLYVTRVLCNRLLPLL
jgi:hypothetical protein